MSHTRSRALWAAQRGPLGAVAREAGRTSPLARFSASTQRETLSTAKRAAAEAEAEAEVEAVVRKAYSQSPQTFYERRAITFSNGCLIPAGPKRVKEF